MLHRCTILTARCVEALSRNRLDYAFSNDLVVSPDKRRVIFGAIVRFRDDCGRIEVVLVQKMFPQLRKKTFVIGNGHMRGISGKNHVVARCALAPAMAIPQHQNF